MLEDAGKNRGKVIDYSYLDRKPAKEPERELYVSDKDKKSAAAKRK